MSDTDVRIVGVYYRSLSGKVIHLDPCPRKGGAVRWHHADNMSLHEVAATVAGIDWMRLCRHCWPAAALPVPAGEAHQ